MNNMITLENGILTAKVNPWGAELTSLKLDGMELSGGAMRPRCSR